MMTLTRAAGALIATLSISACLLCGIAWIRW
jgi:hypothetical protein